MCRPWSMPAPTWPSSYYNITTMIRGRIRIWIHSFIRGCHCIPGHGINERGRNSRGGFLLPACHYGRGDAKCRNRPGFQPGKTQGGLVISNHCGRAQAHGRGTDMPMRAWYSIPAFRNAGSGFLIEYGSGCSTPGPPDDFMEKVRKPHRPARALPREDPWPSSGRSTFWADRY
jgi:hypothetical protein